MHSVGLTRMKRSSTGGGGDGGKKQKGADFEGDFPRGKPAASDMKDMKKPQTKVRRDVWSASAAARDSRRCSHQEPGVGFHVEGIHAPNRVSAKHGATLSPHQSNITALPW